MVHAAFMWLLWFGTLKVKFLDRWRDSSNTTMGVNIGFKRGTEILMSYRRDRATKNAKIAVERRKIQQQRVGPQQRLVDYHFQGIKI